MLGLATWLTEGGNVICLLEVVDLMFALGELVS